MRSTAQINQGTAAIHGTLLPSHKLVNIVQLVLAVRKHLLEVLLGDLQSVEALLLLENARGLGLKCRPIRGDHDTTVENCRLVNSQQSIFSAHLLSFRAEIVEES
jgi:hypothetical protein